MTTTSAASGAEPVTIRLLGPLDVIFGDSVRCVSGMRRKTALATLALRVGEVVSTDRLIDVVWGGRSPVTAVNTLQSHISYLRRLFGACESIVTRPAGYCLEQGEIATDVQLAERLIDQARRSADASGRAAKLRDALSHWRGRPLDDLSAHPWLDEQAERLERVRLMAVNMLTDARLDLGEHASLIPELEDLTRRYPFDEAVHRQLMLALYRTGRQADALSVFHQIRSRLGDELGIAPGRSLRALEEAILHHDAALDPPVPAPVARTPNPVVPVVPVTAGHLLPVLPGQVIPAQLPAREGRIVGRLAELDQLDHAMARGRGSELPSTVILTVSGTPGVGKTALAVHWAQRVAGQFPDGQLYVDLRGFDPSGMVMDPADALRGLLDALGVPPHASPAGLQAQVGLYRSLLAGKRILVVLDNARDTAHVRPLLPGSPGCVAVVTSRTDLTPLVITEGAQQLTLGLLSPAEAYTLLAGRLGADRVRAEREAAEEIIDGCGGLPLALAIVAARAAAYPVRPLTRLAADMGSAPLDVLTGGDPATDLRAVFSWSYRSVGYDAARLFRALGSHPGPATAHHAAALTNLSVHRARLLLDELVGAHLLTRHAPGTYVLHGLLRAYAVELWRQRESEKCLPCR
ncbi:AfsR/SARP family transcriptional regulator [Nonomuraea cavernae]|uniref:AfsR/SARP family transcriptional regulator n=1 Tax=Nonomuraea cavernae TaxID=2045107 RepID=UPI00166CAE02|nr:AfsR/SARP family transcriptional regulator [Nonomuraea cavernae]MCA2183626.1 winged helix-turn-helix domain-containing protein [Nonomuraea cavernae]